MNVETSDLSDTRKLVTITFSGEETSSEDRKTFGDILKHAQLPGFRPGKAPAQMIRARFQKEITAEIHRQLGKKAYEDGLKKTDLKVLEIIDYTAPEPIVIGQDAVFKMTVDIYPGISLPNYRGLPTQLPSAEVSDEEVQTAVEQLRRERSSFLVVDRPARPGDYVRLSYRGSIDGQLIAELVPTAKIWGTQDSTWEEAGAQLEYSTGVRCVVDGIVGLAKDQKATFSQTFPEDFSIPELAGKTAQYEVEIFEVRERQLAELNEEFLSSVKAKTIEELHQQLREDLRGRKVSERRRMQQRQVLDQLGAAVDFPIPESLLEGIHQEVMREIMEQNMRKGVPEEEFEKNKEAFYEQSRKLAIQRARNDLLLNEIAQAEKIQVTNDDLSRAVYVEAMKQRVRPEQLVKELQKDRNQLQRLQQNVLFSKTLDFLCKEAIVQEIVVTPPAESLAQDNSGAASV